MNGSYDLAGLLIEGVGAPVRVEQVQLFDQTVVLSQKERVKCDQSQMFVGSGITCDTQLMNSSCSRAGRKWLIQYIHSLTSLKA